jgi:uncharacterized repeat protein (TIGR01451 family)
VSNDQGQSGAGGALTDTDNVPITVGSGAIADLAITMTDAPHPVLVGSDSSYAIQVKNNGPFQATTVTVIDILPAGLTFVSTTASQGACTFLTAARTVRCDLGSLANAGTASATIVATSTQQGTITNQAVVAANQSDPLTRNNTAVVQTIVFVDLTNDVPVVGLSGTQGSERLFRVSVPAGSAGLTVTTGGGQGEADLYVRFGTPPTTVTHDCSSLRFGTFETCGVNTPSAGTWFMMIRGVTAYSGVTITASVVPDITMTLTNNVSTFGLSGIQGSERFWKITVPTGMVSLTVTITGGTGDADLYVRRRARPSQSTYDCRPYMATNNERCTFTDPAAGDWYVMILGFDAYNGVMLTGTFR